MSLHNISVTVGMGGGSAPASPHDHAIEFEKTGCSSQEEVFQTVTVTSNESGFSFVTPPVQASSGHTVFSHSNQRGTSLQDAPPL